MSCPPPANPLPEPQSYQDGHSSIFNSCPPLSPCPSHRAHFNSIHHTDPQASGIATSTANHVTCDCDTPATHLPIRPHSSLHTSACTLYFAPPDTPSLQNPLDYGHWQPPHSPLSRAVCFFFQFVYDISGDVVYIMNYCQVLYIVVC